MKKTQKIISTVLVIMLLFSCISALHASAEEAPAPACAVYFHNTLGWENVYQYAWDESGNPLTGDWPGEKLNVSGKDDYGYDVYSINIPAGASGIVLNNNDGDQTDDITDFTVSGWYLDAEKTGLNIYGSKVYEVIPLTDTEHWTEPVDEPEPTPEPANFKRYMIGDTNGDDTIDINDVTLIQRYLAQMSVPDTYNPDAADADQSKEVKINDATLIQYFIARLNHSGSFCGRPVKNGKLLKVIEYTIYDSLGWDNFNIIARDKGNRVLPGVSISYTDKTVFGWDTYSVKIPEDAFSLSAVSADGSKHTPEIKFDPIWSTEYAIMVDPYSETPREILNDVATHWAPPPEDPEFLFENTMKWDEVYAYAWNENGADLLGAWPGTKLTDITSTADGNDIYKVTVPYYDTKGVILNDGKNRNQTITITDFYPEGGGYYLDPEKTVTDEFGQQVPALVPFKDTPKSEFLFANSLNWNDVYVIMYNEKGVVSQDWPGAKQTVYMLNDYGEEIYRIKVPKNVTGLVICDGKDGQTSMITDFNQSAYYLTDSEYTVNNLGEIEYTPCTFN